MKGEFTSAPLGRVCKIFNGNSINTEYKRKHFYGNVDGYPYIATKDVSLNGNINYDNGVHIPPCMNYKIAPKGSVFICAEGGSAGKKIAKNSQDVCFGNKLFCLVPNEKIDNEFLYLFLLSDSFKLQFKEKISGLISGVSAKKFNDIIISYPSIEEQRAIVSKINMEFARIDQVKQNAANSLEESKTLMSLAITESLRPKSSWNSETLQDLSIVHGNYGLSASAKEYDGKTRYIRITDITEWGDLNDDCVSADISYGTKQSRLEDGDILFARTGATVGKTLQYKESFGECLFAGYLIRYRLEAHKVLPRFVFYYTHSNAYYDWIATNQKVTAQPNISARLYNQLVINYPDIKEQQAIVERLDDLYSKVVKLKDNYISSCNEVEKLKQSILRNIFN